MPDVLAPHLPSVLLVCVCTLTTLFPSCRFHAFQPQLPRAPPTPQFSKEHFLSINNIASLLKQFLNALPRPLLSSQTEGMLQAFGECSPVEMKHTLFDLFMVIEDPYRSTALALLNHMLKVRATVACHHAFTQSFFALDVVLPLSSSELGYCSTACYC